jgi:hypothetical protein
MCFFFWLNFVFIFFAMKAARNAPHQNSAMALTPIALTTARASGNSALRSAVVIAAVVKPGGLTCFKTTQSGLPSWFVVLPPPQS